MNGEKSFVVILKIHTEVFIVYLIQHSRRSRGGCIDRERERNEMNRWRPIPPLIHIKENNNKNLP